MAGTQSSRRSELPGEHARRGRDRDRLGAERGRGVGGEQSRGRESETRPGEERSVGPRRAGRRRERRARSLPWPAESMFRRRPGRNWARGRGGERRSGAGSAGKHSPRTHQPAEPLQPPWHYVISDAPAHFRFDARSAFVPPPRALSNKGVVGPVRSIDFNLIGQG